MRGFDHASPVGGANCTLKVRISSNLLKGKAVKKYKTFLYYSLHFSLKSCWKASLSQLKDSESGAEMGAIATTMATYEKCYRG